MKPVGTGVDLIASVHAELLETSARDVDLRTAAMRAVRNLAPLMPAREQALTVDRVLSELAGLGALDEYLADPTVQEVMVNASREVWIDRHGTVERIGHLPVGAGDVLLERILAPLGRRLDRCSPMVDARLADGSRVCAVIPPASPDGATFTIRRFGVHRHDLDDFASPAVVEVLEQIVKARCNVVVSGATSSGKTTLLNALAAHVPADERLITLEDTLELALHHDHVVRLEARAETADGVPAIGLDMLLRTALRLRPDRLVVGEVRGSEAVVLVQAMGTGHDGSLATVHANDAIDALRRLEVLIMQSAPTWPLAAVRDHLRSSIDVVVHVGRRGDGRRVITEIAEVAEVGDAIDLHDTTSHDTATPDTPTPTRPLAGRGGISLRHLAHGDHVLRPLTRGRRSAR
jgi:pilus assembly protein CpaF